MPEEEGAEVIATTMRGNLYFYPIDDFGSSVPRKAMALDPDSFAISTPAVGDVTGDGNSDVVVTTLWHLANGACGSDLIAGKIFVIDENEGDTLAMATDCSFHFRREDDGHAPAGPALADLDEDGALEILVAGTTASTVAGTYPADLTLFIFKYNAGELVMESATDSIPLNWRNDYGGTPMDDPLSIYGAHYAIGTPIVGDFDPVGDGHVRPDIIVTSSQGGIFAFEYDSEADSLYSKRGWPLLLPDVAREPVLTELEPTTDPGQFSLVVQCQDGFLHVFDLPKTTTDSLLTGWPSYGGDPGNTRGKLSGPGQKRGLSAGSIDPRQGARFGVIQPVPTRGRQRIEISSERPDDVVIAAYDVQGREVREIFRGEIRAGSTDVWWDGLLDHGNMAPSGVYWIRLRTALGHEERKIVLLR